MSTHEFTLRVDVGEDELQLLNREEASRGPRAQPIPADPSEWVAEDLRRALDWLDPIAEIVDYRAVLAPGEQTRLDVEARKAARV